jgi:hypothetical protein
MNWKSVLKPENSVIAGIAVAGSVLAIYSMDVGPVSQAHATESNHPALEASRKKAGYTSFLFVSALTLITKDANVGILGFGSIVAMEMHYKHAIMANPATGKMQAPSASSYQPAEPNNVVQLPSVSEDYNAYDYGYGS